MSEQPGHGWRPVTHHLAFNDGEVVRLAWDIQSARLELDLDLSSYFPNPTMPVSIRAESVFRFKSWRDVSRPVESESAGIDQLWVRLVSPTAEGIVDRDGRLLDSDAGRNSSLGEAGLADSIISISLLTSAVSIECLAMEAFIMGEEGAEMMQATARAWTPFHQRVGIGW